jgi:anti-sigma B factor antagonist/stage II sporulation protein AA (anti-sigma F factor antagonist)
VQFQSRHFDSVAVAMPAGRLDHSVAGDFEQLLLPLAQNAQNSCLVVDFSRVDYISSVGLRVLMLAAKAMRARKARIAAVALQPIVAEIFAISRFNSVYELFPSVADALRAMSPDASTAYEASLSRNN